MSLLTTTSIAEARERLMNHALYAHVDSLPKLRVFMESHAFAVWDFMSLLKRLQADLCPARVPWIPPKNVAAARFINEIVLAEESDLDLEGRPAGHLDLYLSAMDEIGADTSGFRAFLAKLVMGRSVREALNAIRARKPVRDFVESTLLVAQHGTTVEVAASFLYGREDPIPRMFESLLAKLASSGVRAERFAYYLARHIELDGDSHGPLGEKLLAQLSAGDPQRELAAQAAAERAIAARIALWSGIQREVELHERDPEWVSHDLRRLSKVSQPSALT